MLQRITITLLLVATAVAGFLGARYLETDVGLPQAIQDQFGLEPPDADPNVPGTDEAPRSPGRGEDRGEVPDVPQLPLASAVEPPASGAYWGVSLPSPPGSLGELRDVVEELERRPAIVMFFQEWGTESSFPVELGRDLLDQGIVPMVTWEAWRAPSNDPSIEPESAREESAQPDFRLERIIDGTFDEYIRSYAEQVRTYAGPVMLRPFHEFNGFWYPWAGTVNDNEPQDVVAAWRHVHEIFEEVGATNVTWVWSPNHVSLPRTDANDVDNYWPGARYVDWVGLSGLNFGTTSQVSSWNLFPAIYDEILEQVETYDKPIVLAEIASVEEGGNKAAWIQDAFEHIVSEDSVVDGAVWFDRQVADLRDFRYDSNDAALEAFREAIRGSLVDSAPAAIPDRYAGFQPGPSATP